DRRLQDLSEAHELCVARPPLTLLDRDQRRASDSNRISNVGLGELRAFSSVGQSLTEQLRRDHDLPLWRYAQAEVAVRKTQNDASLEAARTIAPVTARPSRVDLPKSSPSTSSPYPLS